MEQRSIRAGSRSLRFWTSAALGLTVLATLLTLGVGFSGPAAWWVGVALLLLGAAVVGRTDAGLPVAWGVLFGPVAAGTLAFWVRNNGPAGVPEGLFWSGVVTVVVGSVGFALGRVSSPGAHDPVLLGRDRTESRRWALGAVVGGAAVFLALAALMPQRLVPVSPAAAQFDGGFSPELLFGSLPLLAGVTAFHAYWNDGLAVCWFVAGVLPAGFLAMSSLFPVALTPDVLVRSVVTTVAITAVVGFAAGTVGYVVGVSGRQLVTRVRGRNTIST